jgi:hypothetical protein
MTSNNSSLALLTAVVLTLPGLAAGADYQYSTLFNPSQSQLEAETRGRVMIYDGLAENDVGQALDTQFERIDNMMFTRIHRTVEDDGKVEVVVDDDGC